MAHLSIGDNEFGDWNEELLVQVDSLVVREVESNMYRKWKRRGGNQFRKVCRRPPVKALSLNVNLGLPGRVCFRL